MHKAVRATLIVAGALILGISAVRVAKGQGLKDYPAYDLWGHKYPPQCRTDMSALPINIYTASKAQMRPGYIGECVDCDKPERAFIMIWDGLVDEPGNGRKWRTEAIRHERCHFKMQLLGLDRYWHPD